jgi:Protein of unknown function (DUF2892)
VKTRVYLTSFTEDFDMTIEKAVLAFAGVVILVSMALAYYVHPNWFWVTAFMGANLLQSAFTGVCPLAMILKKLGVPSGAAF